MKKTKAHELAALFLIAGVAGGCGSAHNAQADDPSKAPTAAVVKVTRHDLADKLEIASELQPFQEIEVYAKVSGYIRKLYVDWGTHVKQGQLLAVLEIPELQQQLLQDEAAVRRADQRDSGARSTRTRAESRYSVAHSSH